MGVCDYTDFVQRNGQCLKKLELNGTTKYARNPELYAADDTDDEQEQPDSDLDESDDDISYEDRSGSYGSNEAVIVRVPKTHTKREILSWKLQEFSKFPTLESEYSWDPPEFPEVSEYFEALASDDWWDHAIWSSPDYPNDWLVNFEPATYEAFVRGRCDPNKIPRWYFLEAYENRVTKRPLLKSEAYAELMEGGQDSLEGYDSKNREQPEAAVREDYISDSDPLWDELGI